MGKKRIAWHKRLLQILGICLAMLGLCSIAFAEELDPRWKWYSSTSYESEYFDTNTIEYDADSQIARVWTLNLNAEGRKIQAIKIQISYVTKKINLLQSVTYGLNKTLSHLFTNTVWTHIQPESADEALANGVASILHINPIYQGGSDRWKWLHSNDQYGLYIAKDTLAYDPVFPAYTIWAKKVYLDGSTSQVLYYMDLPTKLIWGDGPIAQPYPESNEEYVYNAVKEMLE